jgi:hypothetical protein
MNIPVSGSEYYKRRKLVGVVVYIPWKVSALYQRTAKKLQTSAQKLMADVLLKNRPRG